MATNVKVDRQAIRALLRSNEVRQDLERRARNIAAAAGPGHRIDTQIGPNRVRVAVITESIEAIVSEAEHRTLTRAVDAGRS